MTKGRRIDPECNAQANNHWKDSNSPTYQSIRSRLNWLYQIKDPAQSEAFHNRLDHSRSNFFMWFVFAACILFMGPTIVISLREEVVENSHPLHLATTGFMVVCILITFLCSLVLVLVESNISFRYTNYCSQRIHIFRQVLFFAICLYSCVLFAKRNIFPMCGHGAAREYSASKWLHYNCQTGQNQAEIMLGHMFSLVTVFMVFVVNIPSLRIEHVWLVCGLIFLVIAVALTRVPNTQFVSATCMFWATCTYAVIVDVHLRNVFQFFSAEYEHQQSEQFAWELKHTIANVAHDLKTPLSSFSNGVEVLKGVWSDLQLNLRASDNGGIGRGSGGSSVATSTSTGALIQQFCQQIDSCLQSIECTTVFMTMAINRCLDATKASNDMKLVPKYESLRLVEVIRLPISIMQSVQAKIPLSLVIEEVAEICNFVITDRQWLQENILCLLSNAVKYSSSGQVVLRVHKSLGDTLPEQGSDSKEKEDSRHGSARWLNAKVHKNATEKTLVTSTSDARLVFEVEDEGIGVDEKDRRRLFVPFQQSQRHAGGTGLGLYSLAKRVEALGGRYGIRRRSDQKRGSVFWFSIPYRPDAVMSEHDNAVENLEVVRPVRWKLAPVPPRLDEASVSMATVSYSSQECAGSGANTERSNGSRTTGGGGSVNGSTAYSSATGSEITMLTPLRSLANQASISKEKPTERVHGNSEGRGEAVRVLLVDDAPTIVKMTKMMLQRIRCQVVTAENGQDAIDYLQNEWNASESCPDLILMDLQMPVLDGIQATHRIRALPCAVLSRIVIVGMSANSDNETMEQALAAGVTRFLPKPITVDMFRNVLVDYLPHLLAND